MMKDFSIARGRRGSRRDRGRGAAMVEFALTFTLLLTLIVATIEGALMIWSWVTLAHATREGARFALVHGERSPRSDTVIETYVKDRAVGLQRSDLNVSMLWSDAAKECGSQVEVDSTYTFHFAITPLLTGGRGVTLRSRSRVTVAN